MKFQVSPEDYERVSQFTWYRARSGKKAAWYIRRLLNPKDMRSKVEYLHRFIMKPPEGLVVDHISGDTLDNRRENLRVVTNSENLMNNYRRREGLIWKTFVCSGCKKEKTVGTGDYNNRKKMSVSGDIYCSYRCSAGRTKKTERNEEFRKFLLAGNTIESTARTFGITSTRAQTLAGYLGIKEWKTDTDVAHEELSKKVRALHAEGMTIYQISKLLNMNWAKVQRHLERDNFAR